MVSVFLMPFSLALLSLRLRFNSRKAQRFETAQTGHLFWVQRPCLFKPAKAAQVGKGCFPHLFPLYADT